MECFHHKSEIAMCQKRGFCLVIMLLEKKINNKIVVAEIKNEKKCKFLERFFYVFSKRVQILRNFEIFCFRLESFDHKKFLQTNPVFFENVQLHGIYSLARKKYFFFLERQIIGFFENLGLAEKTDSVFFLSFFLKKKFIAVSQVENITVSQVDFWCFSMG